MNSFGGEGPGNVHVSVSIAFSMRGVRRSMLVAEAA